MGRMLLLLALIGCASGGTAEESGTQIDRPAIFTSAETGTIMGDAVTGEATTIAAPPATVWSAVKTLYGQLGVPITLDNPAGHQIGTSSLVATRQLAGQPMTTFVDCGQGITGAKAASYRITAVLVSDVIPVANGETRLRTTFDPNGQDITGASSDRVHCASTGRLELLMLDSVRAIVAKP